MLNRVMPACLVLLTLPLLSCAAAPPEAYIADIGGICNEIDSSFKALASLLADPRFNDASWTAQMNQTLDAITLQTDKAGQLSAPAGFAEIHNYFTAAMEEIHQGASDIRESIKTSNLSLLDQAAAHILKSKDYLAISAELKNQYLDNR